MTNKTTKKPTPVKKPVLAKRASVEEVESPGEVEEGRGSAMEDQKKAQVSVTIASLIAKHGKEAVTNLISSSTDVQCWSTQYQHLDDILTGEGDKYGNLIPNTGKGFPKGRIMEVYGPESSGKTTLTYLLIAAVQKQGGACLFIDAEHSMDKVWAEKLGVNIFDLVYVQPDNAEQAFEMMTSVCRNPKSGIDLIILDSVTAMVPKDEIEEDAHVKTPAVQARLMSEFLRKIAPLSSGTQTTVIFINQIRMKIGVMFGNPETTTGGNALKFYASIRLEIRRQQNLKGDYKGIQSRIRVIKNKVAPPFRECYLDIRSNGTVKTHEGD